MEREDAAPVQALRDLKLKSAWLDGEVVVAGENGLADFQALQNAFDTEHDERITYYVFDLPFLGGQDLRQVPLQDRRETLRQLLEGRESEQVKYSADFDQPVDSLLDSACRLELEGLIGKRAESPYSGRRSSDWIKPAQATPGVRDCRLYRAQGQSQRLWRAAACPARQRQRPAALRRQGRHRL